MIFVLLGPGPLTKTATAYEQYICRGLADLHMDEIRHIQNGNLKVYSFSPIAYRPVKEFGFFHQLPGIFHHVIFTSTHTEADEVQYLLPVFAT